MYCPLFVKWYDSKPYLANWILEHFPEHSTYLEPFGGGASVLINKDAADEEIYNDIDERIVNTMLCLRDRGPQFIEHLEKAPFSETRFEEAEEDEPVCIGQDGNSAANAFIRAGQSCSTQSESWVYSNGDACNRWNGDAAAWRILLGLLPEINDRLTNVNIRHSPAIVQIREYDDPNVLIYCDPPHWHHNDAGKKMNKGKGHGMGLLDHLLLAEALNATKSKVVVGGYNTAEYRDIYKGWRMESTKGTSCSSMEDDKAGTYECLWFNYPESEQLYEVASIS